MSVRIFVLLILLGLAWGQTLSSADCINYQYHTYQFPSSNSIGLSMQILEFYPYFDDQLYQSYLINSLAYGSWGRAFAVSLHNQIGAKYNCSLAMQIANTTTLDCTLELKNSTLIQKLGGFAWNVTNIFGTILGWDNQAANYTNSNYMANMFVPFYRDVYNAARQPSLVEVADRANEWNATGLRPGYDFKDPEKDCTNMNSYLYIYYESPGLTESANSSWYDQMAAISYECGTFTLRATVFPNVSDLTIANLLSSNYTSQYLQRRFTANGTNYIGKLSQGLFTINDLRLVSDPMGIDGLTNSFAAGIWAVEFLMEWVVVDGFRAYFLNPLNSSSFQTVLGGPPNYAPSVFYYALLFTNIVSYYYPYIILPTMTAGTSSSIKIYYLDYWSFFGVLILNKDLSRTANGFVDVVMKDQSGLNCMYLSAAQLNSTSNFTLHGYSFVSGSALPQGTFKIVKVFPINGIYSVPLNYSQMVFCRTQPSGSNYISFPRWGRSSGESFLALGVAFLLILLS